MTQEWYDSLILANLYNLEVSTSDHSPLLLDPRVKLTVHLTKKFKFENAWLRGTMRKELVLNSWKSVGL